MAKLETDIAVEHVDDLGRDLAIARQDEFEPRADTETDTSRDGNARAAGRQIANLTGEPLVRYGQFGLEVYVPAAQTASLDRASGRSLHTLFKLFRHVDPSAPNTA